MREIEFRGKDIGTGKWCYGDLILTDTDAMISDSFSQYTDGYSQVWGNDVEIETLGQYTGLVNKKGKKIYEGDIVRYNTYIGIIMFGQYEATCGVGYQLGFYVNWKNDKYNSMRPDIVFWASERDIEVIGNIHDNPELIRSDK